MNIESKLSGHWTDDQLIAHLYGVGPQDGHLKCCAECQSRLSAMERSAAELRQHYAAELQELPPGRLAEQRRRVYAALSRPARWWQTMPARRWAPAGAAAFCLVASLFYYGEQQHEQAVRNSAISDAQLAQDVSNLSGSTEAPPTEPLQGLFVE